VTASIAAVGALGVDSMANVSELIINAVKMNKPKVLTGLTQKGRDPVLGYPVSPTTATTGTGGQAAPTLSWQSSETW